MKKHAEIYEVENGYKVMTWHMGDTGGLSDMYPDSKTHVAKSESEAMKIVKEYLTEKKED